MTSPPRPVLITYAQSRVLRQLVHDGADNLVLADRLSLSPNTIKTHMRALLALTGYPNRTALVIAILRGDIRPEVRRPAHWSRENAA